MMNEVQNTEICRVCRSEGTPEQPLFYPCLCSGSIKYIHQDCLIEWLKHSKKRYCELCKHPFTFSPIYAEQMPNKIPISVLLFGLVKKSFTCFRVGLSLSFAAILWLIAVPVITSQIFRYYFGWSLQGLVNSTFSVIPDDLNDLFLETVLAVLFDALQGFLLTGLTVFLVLGMMLVREFIAMIRHTSPPTPTIPTPTTTTRNRRDVNEDVSVTSDSPIRPVTNPLSPTRRHSEFHRPTPLSPSGNSSGNFWLDQVHPKEYRNYLRRRELHRESIEAEQNRSFTEFTDGESDALLSNEDHISNISGTTTLRSRFTTTTSAGPSRESFRCRICSSNTCINREHVVQASQLRNALAAQRHQSLLHPNEHLTGDTDSVSEAQSVNGTSSNSGNSSNSGSSNNNNNTNNSNNNENITTNTTPNTPNSPNTTDNTLNNTANNTGTFGWNLDATESLSFPEFFGFTLEGTPVLELLQNAAIVIGCNTLVMHLFLFVPFITGKAVCNGTLFYALTKFFEAFTMLFIKSESIQMLSQVVNSRISFFKDIILGTESPLFKYLSLFTFNPDSLAAFAYHVILGYAVLCSVLSIYLKFTRNLTDSFHRLFVPIVSFVGVFIKLITLLFIEMAVFPLICGVMVDFFSLSLFPSTSIYTRLQLSVAMPISSLVVHWALGAFFMISFASFVTFLRSFLRPGLLFFLRNPVDPDNHPVKEMVERGFLDQIYRLGISVIFYAFLISSSIGLSITLVTKFTSVFPLNLNFQDPLIEIPIDLLLQLMLRSLFNTLAPKKLFKSIFCSLSRRLLRSLRLSSYFLGGGRYLNEESFPKGGNWVAVPDFDRIYQRKRLNEIRSRSITPVDISKLKILVDRQGLPVISTNNTPSSSTTTSTTSSDWTVVFRPNWFKLKCLLTLLFTIATIQIFLGFIFLAPLISGRFIVAQIQERILAMNPPKPIHEIYSWTLGAIFVLCLARALEFICFPVKKPRSDSETELSFPSKIVHLIGVSLKIVVISLFVGLLWPLQIGILFSLLVNPLLYTVTINHQNNPAISTIPIVFVGACWSIGFPLLRLLFSVRSQLPLSNRTLLYLNNLTRTRFNDLSVKDFIKFAGVPITLLLTVTLILPPLSCLIAVPLFMISNPSMDLMIRSQQSSHLLALSAFIILKSIKAAIKLYRKIISGIRDETYLIGRRLHNLESRTTRRDGNNTVNTAGNNTAGNSEIMSPLM